MLAAIAEEPPANLADGGAIRDWFRRRASTSCATFRTTAGPISRRSSSASAPAPASRSLKVRFNNVFGYYIEISKSNLHLAPADYERKQTLVNAERFTTPELKELEGKILEAEEKILDAGARDLRAAPRSGCFARRAHQSHSRGGRGTGCRQSRWPKSPPKIATRALAFRNRGEMRVVAGRHPVIEKLAEKDAQRFIPNDLYFHPETEFIAVITGPNMGGKSTYLRQAALLVILAQMGSFVPAESALLPIVDRVFTRIGAADNLARGRSTFMVEMTETAVILNTATSRSLIVLDEIGRGTSTYDGLALAWAVVEHIHRNIRAKTLFATHYHELTELAEQLEACATCTCR